MSTTRHAVLRSVYEDNLGLPRTFAGKRAARSARHRPLKALGSTGKAALIGLCAAVAWLGLDLRVLQVAGSGPDSTGFHVAQGPLLTTGASAIAVPMAPLAANAVTPDVILPVDPTDGYMAMLGELDVGVADLFDLQVRTIVIDPGHGGRDPGAMGQGALKEKDVVLDIARRLRKRLETSGNYRVLLTREDDTLVHLKDRVQFATRNQADLFISLHINAVPPEAGSLNYVETYYFGPHTDQRTLDLAQAENRGSSYPIGHFRRIIARIGDTLKMEESARLAGTIHNRLYANLKEHSEGLIDAGVKTGPFVVLLGVEVPSVLVEIACISNEAEAERLSTPLYRDSIARYLHTGIVDYLQQRAADPIQNGARTEYVVQQQQ